MFEYISAFDFTYEIVQTKTKKLEISLNIEFGRAVLSTVSVSRKKLWNHLRNPYSKRRDRNHPILSGYPVPVEKISIYKVTQKSSRPVFYPVSYKQPLIHSGKFGKFDTKKRNSRSQI